MHPRLQRRLGGAIHRDVLCHANANSSHRKDAAESSSKATNRGCDAGIGSRASQALDKDAADVNKAAQIAREALQIPAASA